jgi:hypothetical protein
MKGFITGNIRLTLVKNCEVCRCCSIHWELYIIFGSENLKVRDHLEDLVRDGRMLKRFSKK